MPEDKHNKTQYLEEERKIMAAYSDSAKTYTQLSLGALVLSITFIEKVLGQTDRIPVTVMLALSWVFWLLATLAGAFYQYLAVRFLEARGEDWGVIERGGHPQAFQTLARHPWKIYLFLLVTFYLGCVLFAIFGALKLYVVK